MNKKELNKAIKESKYIFGWVNLTQDDGAYIQLTKGSIKEYIKHMDNHIIYNAILRDDGDLYIG